MYKPWMNACMYLSISVMCMHSVVVKRALKQSINHYFLSNIAVVCSIKSPPLRLENYAISLNEDEEKTLQNGDLLNKVQCMISETVSDIFRPDYDSASFGDGIGGRDGGRGGGGRGELCNWQKRRAYQ